ncbi:hypothetical protein ACL02R_22885 [Streptomyces sp. MS19]|uniref:hypothetical protein n=1 Tax=Streptomyces sp. MS19 TaxID=3385972 RepID=UPI0039A047B6
MDRDAAMVGHWTSEPFDYGAMESSALALLPDGGGWTVYASVSGTLSVTRFLWGCPRAGVLELRMTRIVEGTRASRDDGGFATVETDESCDEALRTGYAFDRVRGGDGAVVEAVRFEEPVEYCVLYARGDRRVTADQDPSWSVVGRDLP